MTLTLSTEKEHDIRDALAKSITSTKTAARGIERMSASLSEARLQLAGLQGEQTALARLFLDGEDMTLQEAYEANLHELKDQVNLDSST